MFAIYTILGLGCGWYNDSILCWPPTPRSSLARAACADIPELRAPCHTGTVFLYCDSQVNQPASRIYKSGVVTR